MAKHVEAVGTLENFKAPWETDAGEVEIDKDRLKRYIFNLVTDKAKAQDARDEAADRVKGIETELTEAKAEVAKGDSTGKIAQLEKDLTEAKSAKDAAEGKLLRLEVGAEKGLTPKQAARLQGATKEELEADADEILETFGVAKQTQDPDDDGDDDGDEDEGLRSQPRSLTNPADRTNKGDKVIDYDKVVAGFDRRTI